LELKGWVRTSLIDFPDHIATVLFTGGCNFRCPMCHNAELVLRPDTLPTLPEGSVVDFLSRRTGLIDGVVLTGGEPTIQPRLAPFLRWLRQTGVDVKLDTNGYLPRVLDSLIRQGLVDYVAMDVKGPPGKYPLLAGRAELDLTRVERSVALLKQAGVGYEFRTTVVPGLLTGEDVEEIARWISGAERYVLQAFRPQGTLDPALADTTPYSQVQLEVMARLASRWVDCVMVRE